MKRSLWALPVCVLAVSGIVISANAQRASKNGRGGGSTIEPGLGEVVAPAPVDGPFVLGSYTWPSKADFIKAGMRCGTPNPGAAEMLALEKALANGENPAAAGPGSRNRRFLAASAPIVIIPVYVHIMTSTQGAGNISDADVEAQIAMINESFAGLDPRNETWRVSDQASADVPYRYVLQGVARVANNRWYQPSSWDDITAMKTALRVGGPETLNIYTGDIAGGLLGFATFPNWYQTEPELDGVWVHREAWINGAFTGYNKGDTTVHEIGHWMGLFHTFQGPGFTGCERPGDSVSDTPAEDGPYFGTPDFTGYPDTCSILGKPLTYTASPGRDPIENFMDYSDDIVMYQFTNGQSSRMQKMVKKYRRL